MKLTQASVFFFIKLTPVAVRGKVCRQSNLSQQSGFLNNFFGHEAPNDLLFSHRERVPWQRAEI